MCTVTFIPASRDRSFVLTSNRDERASRPTKSPMIYEDGSVKLAYPKDEQSGGTWIAMSKLGKINCLLNGGFERHQIEAYQTLSRGIILLDYTKSEFSARDYFTEKDLHPVEPFTMVSIQQIEGKVIDLTEIIWDGKTKHFRNLAISEAHIWSSTTLYDEEKRNLRKKWFADFLAKNKDDFKLKKILGFHSETHSPDTSVNVIMEGIEDLKTVSITQVSIEKDAMKMNYFDLVNDSNAEIIL